MSQVLNELKQYWKESLEYWDDSQSLWGNLCLSLIYISGCSDGQHLIAIQKQLQDAIELEYRFELFTFISFRLQKDHESIVIALSC